jgi:four helix bundle protein
MRDFRELKVWQKAHQVALEIYRHSRTFPTDERFGLTAHLRKSAISVPSNIAEGCGRDTEKELARFLSIAAGSASELEYQLLLAHDLEYLPRDAHAALYDPIAEVKRTLYRFMQSLSAPGLTADRFPETAMQFPYAWSALEAVAPLTAESPAPRNSCLVPAPPG